MPSKEDRKKALDTVLVAIDKQFGKGSTFRQGDTSIKGIEWVSSGSIGLDAALGGGWARSRIVEVIGDPSVGKTSIALHAVASFQEKGMTAAFIDAEHCLELSYAAALNVDVKKLIVSQPDYGEQALEITDMLVRSGAVDIIVIDSVAALVPKAELEGEMDQAQVGLQARLMSKAMRKLSGIVMKSNCLLLFTNQFRSTIGGFGFGPSKVGSGGNALKFYASQRLQLVRTGSVKRGDEVIGNKIEGKVIKNKVAPPFRVAELCISFGKGINRAQETIDLGIKYELIEKSGSWFSLKNGDKIGQGAINAGIWLETHPEVMNSIRTKARNTLFTELAIQ